jgi:hypothetical protein
VVSWKPRAFLYHAFLSDAEALHMKQLAAPSVSGWLAAAGAVRVLDGASRRPGLDAIGAVNSSSSCPAALLHCAVPTVPTLHARPQMKRSTVVAANGSSVLDDYRTSYGTFIK